MPLEAPGGLTAEGDAQVRAKVKDLVLQAHAAQGEGDAEASTALLQKATVLAELMGDHALVAELLVECSYVLAGIGEYRLASRFLDRARQLAADRDVEEIKGEVYRGYGGLYKARGEWDHASVALDRALDKLEFSSRHASVCRALLDLSEIYLRDGRCAEAMHLLQRAKTLPAALDPPLEVRLHLNFGRVAHLGGDLPRALEAYQTAAKVARATQRTFERELICIGLAGLYLEDGQLGPAVQAVREALALSIIASSRGSLERVECARLAAISERLASIDAARGHEAAPSFPGTELDEAVRLYNAHPFVLTGKMAAYGAAKTPPQPAPSAASANEPWIAAPGSNGSALHPNPK
jgi:tetratricopeptide (TPR) repeat protein